MQKSSCLAALQEALALVQVSEEAYVEVAGRGVVERVVDVVDDRHAGRGRRFPRYEGGVGEFGRQAAGEALQDPVIAGADHLDQGGRR
jgi:hypothetical protein